MPRFLFLAEIIDKGNRTLGRILAWLTLGMVLMMCGNVIQRYIFQSNHIWQHELVIYMHALLFMGAAGYTLWRDEHVRVDIIYEHLSVRKKAWVNLLGSLFFLLPVCVALVYFSYGFVVSSWEILEHSREGDGLPGVFLLKSCIWLFAVTLILQGCSLIIRSIHDIRA